MRLWQSATFVLWWVTVCLFTTPVSAQTLRLEVRAPEEFSGIARQIRNYDPNPLLETPWLSDVRGLAAPILVELVTESMARRNGIPNWVAGYAVTEHNLIALFPTRTPSYPNDSLESVLRHEIAHVLIGRAARGRPLPRWFDEGLAITVERPWSLTDRTRFAWTRVVDHQMSFESLNHRFGQGRVAAERAYAISGALVRRLIHEYGVTAPAKILSTVAAGHSFDAATQVATGRSLTSLELEFMMNQSVVERWLPFLTSGYTLWSAVTLLALLAIWSHRQKRKIRRQRWDEEEAAFWDED
tara:strand:+ start:386 stop:1282 length:897 start_codon:yes stop_codon:yes gene_type:complete